MPELYDAPLLFTLALSIHMHSFVGFLVTKTGQTLGNASLCMTKRTRAALVSGVEKETEKECVCERANMGDKIKEIF